jgi:hypothetical protein
MMMLFAPAKEFTKTITRSHIDVPVGIAEEAMTMFIPFATSTAVAVGLLAPVVGSMTVSGRFVRAMRS